jgi:hypothetical protein
MRPGGFSPQTMPAGPPSGAPAGHAAPPSNGRVPAVQSPLPTRERRPGYIALAVALIIGLAAIGAYLYAQAGSKTPVVVVIKTVPVGHTIERSDLSTASVAGEITAIAGSSLDSIVGKTAAVTLLPHTLLQRAMVADVATLPTGQALVGVAVAPGQLPADGLESGDSVEVLGLPGKNSTSSAQVLASNVKVFSTADNPSTQGGSLVTLQVAGNAAPSIAAASNNQLIALVRVNGS